VSTTRLTFARWIRCDGKVSTHPQKNTSKEVRLAPSLLSLVAGAIYLSDLQTSTEEIWLLGRVAMVTAEANRFDFDDAISMFPTKSREAARRRSTKC